MLFSEVCKMYKLPAKWIRQADPFRLAQISPARRNGTRDEHFNIYNEFMKSKYGRISVRKIKFLYIFFNAL